MVVDNRQILITPKYGTSSMISVEDAFALTMDSDRSGELEELREKVRNMQGLLAKVCLLLPLDKQLEILQGLYGYDVKLAGDCATCRNICGDKSKTTCNYKGLKEASEIANKVRPVHYCEMHDMKQTLCGASQNKTAWTKIATSLKGWGSVTCKECLSILKAKESEASKKKCKECGKFYNVADDKDGCCSHRCWGEYYGSR